MSDEYTTYLRTCTLCERTYRWSADDLMWLYEQTPNMPCGHPWRFMQDVEEDLRVFEVKARTLDNPASDQTFRYGLLEVKQYFPLLYEMVKQPGFVHMTLTTDLERIEISVHSVKEKEGD